MQDNLIINCRTKKITFTPPTPEQLAEKARRQAAAIEAERKNELKKAALERAKADKKYEDLLILLGIIEPE